MNNFSKNFFLISFLPALAYWYLEEHYPIKIAVTAGIILSVVEISLEKYFSKEVHTISKFNFFLIITLGALSLFENSGVWFKLTPAITSVAIAIFFLYQFRIGKSVMGDIMIEMIKAKKHPLTQLASIEVLRDCFRKMERDMAYLCLFYGVFMMCIALWASSDKWIFFKTIGLYIFFAIFMIAEFVAFRFKIKRQQEKYLIDQYLRWQQQKKLKEKE
ncbi:MAG: septation protein IspZ [Oligoflexia bacterium]|nr:septation protein IspZ [Oligoflexia bacterium]